MYKCTQCSQVFSMGNRDFILELTCGNCKRQSCGKCLQRSHYPALCSEYERLSKGPSGNAFLDQRLAQYVDVHQHNQNMALVFLNNIQTLYEQFSPEAHERFHKRLLRPFNQMWEIVQFKRWFLLHAVFNPTVEVALANELDLLETRIDAFLDSIPEPDVANDAWNARWRQIYLISVDLGVSISELIYGLPNAHHNVEVQAANKAVAHWSSKLESLFKG